MAIRTPNEKQYLEFQTPHYTFHMTVEIETGIHKKYTFLVGNKESPCIEGNVILENLSGNTRFEYLTNTARLLKIDALEECALNDIQEGYMRKYSFGTELLEAFLFFINSQFATITSIELTDTSYIPCSRIRNESLDLLSYSIATHGKTWYEDKFNAYIQPKKRYDEYRKQVEVYTSNETKNEYTFDEFYEHYMTTSYVKNYINTHGSFEDYTTMFDESATFPEFFSKLSKYIQPNDKCSFYKLWLQNFIGKYVSIERKWYIDLYPKITILEKMNTQSIRNRTRKRTRK
jgi:hypothetical protein